MLLENIFKKHLVVSFLEVGQLNTKGMSLRLVSLSLKIGENMLLDLKCWCDANAFISKLKSV